MNVAIPPGNMPALRCAVIRGMKAIPSFGAIAWPFINRIAIICGGRRRVVQTYADGLMAVDVADFIGARIYHFGVWEPHISAFISTRLKPGDVFCDVGAYTGYYTVLAGSIVGPTGKIVAIEPSPLSSKMLHHNVILNNLTNVRIVTAAVSDRFRTLTLYRPPYENRGATTTLAHRARLHGFLREVEAPALPLDCILLPEEKRHLRLIKIDVEGAEGAIIDNLLMTIGQYSEYMEIICEMSASEGEVRTESTDQLVQRFASAGFRAFAIPNCYEILAYLSFKRPHLPEPIVSPLLFQQDVLFSRQFPDG